MGGLSWYGSAQTLPQTVASDRYLALLEELVPSADTPSSALQEPDFAGYTRPVIHPSDWGTPSQGLIANVNPISLPTPASGQVQIVQCALLDAPSAGNLWWVIDAFQFVLDPADPDPALAPGGLLLGLPWMA